jgi:hypothetical protein
MSQERLISLLNIFSNHITVHEYFEPKFRNFLIGEVIVFGLLLLRGKQFSNFLEIGIGERMLSLDDVINLVNVWLVKISELSLYFLLLLGKLLIKISLLDKVTIYGNGLNLFSESWKLFYLLLNLLLDVNLHE